MTFFGRKYKVVKYEQTFKGGFYVKTPCYAVYRTCTPKRQFGMNIAGSNTFFATLKEALTAMEKHYTENKHNPGLFVGR